METCHYCNGTGVRVFMGLKRKCHCAKLMDRDIKKLAKRLGVSEHDTVREMFREQERKDK